ncbi:penicillin-binding protein 1C [Deefgea rivuli]|uniref:penicillin-binding protein 1C n=1 Tax=Deefgea rivuli TaxID=400948 RepID=UPI001FE22465|nr:penicillin-binding protein 1C [Deefgea rivuli]
MWRSSDVLLLDRHGAPLQRIRVDKTVRKLDWVALNQVSPAFRQALVISEDKRFYQHSGVDWAAVAAAGWGNAVNSKTRGASTLTMQLVGLLDEDLRRGGGGRSVWQKAGQTVSATWLERSWTKPEILESYLNLVSFRGELVGISALSATLFGKAASGLDAREAAIAVALLRAPNAPVAKVAERACGIVTAMKAGDCRGLAGETAVALAQTSPRFSSNEQLAPHFARYVLAAQPQAAGTQIKTTIDADIQRFATQVLRRTVGELSNRNVEDGAVLVLDNASGDVLAWVGSSGDWSRATDVDFVLAERQAGSTLKPFLYQQAIAGRWLTAASLLDDSPLNLNTATGLYNPQNYDKSYKGPVSVRTALASSLNIPAVRTIQMVTPRAFRDQLFALGLSTLKQDGDFYGFSLALGGADVRLLDLSNAYRALANTGVYSLPRMISNSSAVNTQRVLDKASSFIVGDILSDRNARATTFGLENVLATRFWTAVKTGTSKDMRDNWSIGFSRKYTVGVWVGNASGAPMWDVSGMHGAAPVWQAVMNRLHERIPSKAPPLMAGVEALSIQYENRIEAPRRELFLAGTGREMIYAANTAQQPIGITAPIDGAIYALDPDIPPNNQRIVFHAAGTKQAIWWLNKKRIGQGEKISWFPWPGRYRLEMRDAAGKVLAGVKFEVRGAGLK